MNYPLNELDSTEFEDLIVSICDIILGTGTIKFSAGKDGGRDAKFTGTSEKFPSSTEPWSGKFIIQAKHTSNPIASCSDSDFKTILSTEVEEKLLPLKKDKKVDYYLLFTNRKLSGLQDPKIEDFIDQKTKITNCVIGIERIQKWLQDYPKIVKNNNLKRLLLPLEFYEEDLRDLIIAFSKASFSKDKVNEILKDIERIDLKQKNKLNNLTKVYFDNVLKKSYYYFSDIKQFLSDPINQIYKDMYDNTTEDLQEKIIVKREEYKTFDEIFSYLYDFVLTNNLEILKNKRRLIRVFIHYMYFNCDIGIKEEK